MGQWFYGYYIGQTINYTNHSICTDDNKYFSIDPKTVGQNTRIKDKRQKEIYEDDIVLWESDPELVLDVDRSFWYKAQVVWSSNWNGWSLKNLNNDNLEDLPFSNDLIPEVEVIGNIYEKNDKEA